MSVPSPYAQRTASEPREDCRDYLRTGRCKYGASCKYHHPPNVQSGGGMKAPLDPTEPMFPLRPNEPVCQYYMKHGTCKFGQACKFHHPPQSSVAALVGGGNLMMNVPRKPDTQQAMLNATGTDANGVPLMLQFLPQRPDEQDCIYFLKNGRCKYGATCRYHHPINFHQRRQDVHQIQESHVHPKLQYMNQPTAQMRYSHASNGSHMLVSDGSVSYVAVEGSQGKASYQPFSVALVNESGSHPVGLPLTMNHEHGSSSSSIASSYDTASSNLDHLHDPNSLWNRQKGNGSLAPFPSESNGRPHVSRLNPRMGLGQSGGDGTTGPLRHRAASYGSASDSTAYFDATGVSRSGGSSLKSSQSSNSIRWRSDSIENRRRAMSQQFNVPADLTSSSSVPEGLNEEVNGNYSRDRSRPPFLHPSRASRRSRQHPAEVDDGLSMMTSALLNMLDTPEEVAQESFDNLETFRQGRVRSDSTPGPSTTSGSLRYSTSHDAGQFYNRNEYDFSQSIEYPVNGGERGDFTRELPMLSTTHNGSDELAITHDDSANWVSSWQTSRRLGRPLEENAQTMSVIQPHHATNTAHAQANVGLFIP